MPIIAPQVRHQRKPLTMRLDDRVIALLRRYAEFIDSSTDYVANQALVATFANDDDFGSWLNRLYVDEASRLDGVRKDSSAILARRRPRSSAAKQRESNG